MNRIRTVIASVVAIFLCLPVFSAEKQRPNVIIFIADDVSWNDYGCYGNAAARTPAIDALAANGRLFNNAYLTASSCSPSRSSIITGRYPHNNGKAAELHKPISAHLTWFPEVLREAGYYTALSGKNHMTTDKSQQRPLAFDHIDGGRAKGNSGGHASWVDITSNRPQDKPFFFWFASYDAHRDWDADKQWDAAAYGPIHQPEDVVVPPFLSDDPETRQDLASYYNEVTRFDHFIGKVCDELKAQDAFDNTLIFVLADNGRPFPRAKTRLHDSGMKTALVAHWPAGIATPGPSDSYASVIDLAPTILQAAGCATPPFMQGVSLQPILTDAATSVRQAVFSEHNWHDYEALGRGVRKDGWLYVRNYRPQLAWQGPADSVRSPSHQKLLELQSAGSLTPAQAEVLLAPRPEIELYDCSADPFQLSNLATNADHRERLANMSSLLDEWMLATGDSVPDKISPDTFDRRTGNRIPPDQIDDKGTLTPGEDRDADTINDAGPR